MSFLHDDNNNNNALSQIFSGLNTLLNGRKHSSGDLHSRLKTRKILGVGETDNGDIHRSKVTKNTFEFQAIYVYL